MSDARYISDSGDLAIFSEAIIMNGSAGKKEFLNPKLTTPKPPADDVMGGVAMWGSGNDLPRQMINDIEATGVLSGAISAKSRITGGKGPSPAILVGKTPDGNEELKFITDPEIDDWMEMNNYNKYSFDTGQDLYGLGNGFTKYLFSPDRTKLLHFLRTDPVDCRLSEIGDDNRIHNVHISADWQAHTDISDTKKIQTIPLLDRNFPLLDLQSRTRGNVFMSALQYTLTGRKYYSPAPWYAAQKWVKIAQGVPEMKAAMFNNQMSIKYIVTIHKDYWRLLDPEYEKKDVKQQKAVKEEFYRKLKETLKGGDNSYKSIFSTQIYEEESRKHVQAITVEPIDDKIKDGKLLPDSNAADIEILLPLMINPSLFGVEFGNGDAYGGGAGSGSNIREGFLVQAMLVEYERRLISQPFDIAKNLNGWRERFKNEGMLVLRYPSQILTTLNTGANTQSIS